MDTRFPLLQPKHHCVKVTRETVRNQPITRVRAKMGVELDRTRARECGGTGGGEKALLLIHEDLAKEKAVVIRATQLQRPDLR